MNRRQKELVTVWLLGAISLLLMVVGSIVHSGQGLFDNIYALVGFGFFLAAASMGDVVKGYGPQQLKLGKYLESNPQAKRLCEVTGLIVMVPTIIYLFLADEINPLIVFVIIIPILPVSVISESEKFESLGD